MNEHQNDDSLYGKGSLAYQDILELMDEGVLSGFTPDSVQPASVDLSLSDEIYLIRGNVLPRHGERIRDLLREIIRVPHNISEPLVPHQTYLCKIKEHVDLPSTLYGYTNPKSSTGRNDIQVRLLADGVPRFDTVPRGFSGELWVLISSKNFFLKLTPGERLLQFRMFDADTRLQKEEMEKAYDQHKLLWSNEGEEISSVQRKVSDHDGSLILAVDLTSEDIVGFKAKPSGITPVLDFGVRSYNPEDFFEPIPRPRNGTLMLEESRFYIFYTKEWCRVPPQFATEMVAMDERSGEFRSHYAGFIDPGWGHGRTGEERGWPLVLEIRPFDDNLIIRDGQPICKLRYERLRRIPQFVYGETGSHYKKQKGAMLSKHFQQAV